MKAWKTKFNKSKKEYSKSEMKEIIDEGRVLNFKTMVSHYLGNDGKNKKNDQNVEKYCDYGCYCLPLGDKDNWVGAGEPVRVFNSKLIASLGFCKTVCEL